MTSEANSTLVRRIPELDGLRGIAILLVLFYHYFHRFPDHTPFEDKILPLVQYGYLGVHLFFMISGFVIAFTLQRRPGSLLFIKHRFFRLWPAMLVCSIITFAVMHLVDTPFTAERRVGISGFLPSLTFTAPFVWRPFIEVESYVDGAYWSLFVEVRFYFWALLISATLGMRRLPVILLATCLLLTVSWHTLASPRVQFYLDTLFFVPYLPLFVIGVLAQRAHSGQDRLLCLVGLVFAWMAALSLMDKQADMIGITLFATAFVTLIFTPRFLGFLSFPPLVWIGSISYSLYLLHQNIGVAAIAALPVGWTAAAYVLSVGFVMATMMGLASIVFTCVERPAQRIARQMGHKPVLMPET